MFHRVLSYPFYGTLLLALGCFTGCGRTSENSDNSKNSNELSPVQLVQKDLAHFQMIDSAGLSAYDSENDGLFTKIFGGTDGQSVKNYLDERLRYFISENEKGINLIGYKSSRYTKDESGESEDDKLDKQNAEVAAANIGMGVWLSSLVNNQPVTFVYHGSRIPVDSSRVGIMLIGSGYRSKVKTSSDNRYSVPVEYRQATLIHEARHSDCTGGITQTDLEVARSVAGSHEFDKKFSAKACGHLHAICPSDHDFSGLHACDTEAWGAYTIGAVYLRGILKSKNLSATDRAFLEARAIDYESRVLVPQEGSPDMTSEGLRD